MTDVNYESVYNLVDKKVGEVNGSIKDLTRTIEGMQRDIATIQAQNKLTAGLVSIGVGIFFSTVNIVILFLKPK